MTASSSVASCKRCSFVEAGYLKEKCDISDAYRTDRELESYIFFKPVLRQAYIAISANFVCH